MSNEALIRVMWLLCRGSCHSVECTRVFCWMSTVSSDDAHFPEHTVDCLVFGVDMLSESTVLHAFSFFYISEKRSDFKFCIFLSI